MIQWYHWYDAYWTISILTTLAFLLLLITNIDETAVNKESEKPSLSQILMLLNYPLLWVLVICVLLYGMLELGFKTWLPTFNTEVFKLSESQSVVFLSIHAGAIALGRFLLGYLQEKFSWLYIQVANLAFAFILTLAVLSLTSYPRQYVILLAAIFSIIGFFYGSIYPTICSIMLSYLPKVRHSAMSGIIVIFVQLGIALGVSTIGFLSKNFNIHNAFYVMLLPMGILPFLLIFYNKLCVTISKTH
ncbi:hypothetical protein NUACC26_040370 [Scytonema sp. NUACC26]